MNIRILPSVAKPVAYFAAALAVMLLVGSLVWHIPFMIWDHLELAPMYQGWMDGHLNQTTFWKLQGTGHWHIAAYALLLPSAWVTNGNPWLDCILSWVFLVAYASIVLHWMVGTLPLRGAGELGLALLMTFLILSPGHFPNLQMGWQLAVFQTLFGAAVTITALSAPVFSWRLNALAILGTMLGILSFAVSYALFVVVFVMLILRRDIRWSERILYFLPWFVLALVVHHLGRSAQGVLIHFHVVKVAEYALYYLGSALVRFAPIFAPWVAALGLVALVFMLKCIRNWQAAMPWFALMLFALVAALITGAGRGFLGDAQGALVPRYVSFSAVFWTGWLGLLARARADGARVHTELWVGLIGLLALTNAAQMTYEASVIGRGSREVAQKICRGWPNLDTSFLNSLIYSGPDAARSYLQSLHDLNFAPFDTCVPQVSPKQ